MQTKKTPLYQEHITLGAKMIPFAGWEMPLQYSSVKEEHFAVRDSVGIFDVSHMGQVFVSGEDAMAYLQTLVPQDISKLIDGKAIYCYLINDHGGIIDDLIIYRLKQDEYFLIINASRITQDTDRLVCMKKDFNVAINNRSDEMAMIAVQGPKANEVMNALGISTPIRRFAICEHNNMLIASTGYTGEDGFEIVVENKDAVSLWKNLLRKGAKPIGFAARDSLRLEAGYLLYGNDMDESTTPDDIKKNLVKFKMLDKSIPRHDYRIYIENLEKGRVTSGGFSPCANTGIGLGIIESSDPLADGTRIDIMIREKLHPAEIIKKPVHDGNRRKVTP